MARQSRAVTSDGFGRLKAIRPAGGRAATPFAARDRCASTALLKGGFA
jgi:hypothetical protein